MKIRHKTSNFDKFNPLFDRNIAKILVPLISGIFWLQVIGYYEALPLPGIILLLQAGISSYLTAILFMLMVAAQYLTDISFVQADISFCLTDILFERVDISFFPGLFIAAAKHFLFSGCFLFIAYGYSISTGSFFVSAIGFY